MGNIAFRSVTPFASDNTGFHFDFESTWNVVRSNLSYILNYSCSAQLGGSWYIYGFGSQSKLKIESLKQHKGLEFVFSKSILPTPFKIFNWLVASYSGLFKVTSLKEVFNVFLDLADSGMVGLYYVPSNAESRFLEKAKNGVGKEGLNFGVNQSEEYFIYIVDGDNFESKSGIYEIVFCGKDTNSELYDHFKALQEYS